MITVEEIHEKETYYTTELYGTVRAEQREDKLYIDDKFPVPEVRKPHEPRRMGFGRRMVDAPADEIITSNPQVFVEVIKGRKEAEGRIATLFNGWLDILRRQNPNPFKESVKNPLARGENFIQLLHNRSWVTNPIKKDKAGLPVFDKSGMPIFFLVPEPMVIYASPEEDENGMPLETLVIYEKQPRDVIADYPHLAGYLKGKEDKKSKKIKWLEYWRKDALYIEAAQSPITNGVQKNPYGFPPFIRRYSGFGKRSPEGELADLIISDIRFARGLLYDEAVVGSDISSQIHLFAHAPVTILLKGEANVKRIQENLKLGAYGVSIIDNLGDDLIDYKFGERIQPSAEAFNHYERILRQLHERCPFLLAGFPFGTSGTQQRMTLTEGMRRYLSILENTQTAWATAFEKAFEIIKKIPGLKPEGLQEGDLDCIIKCEVRLKASDPVEENRLSLMGSRLLLNKEIDPITNLVEFKGKTKEEAEEIVVDTLAWLAVMSNPDILNLIGLRTAEKSGMTEQLKEIKGRQQEIRKTLGGEMPRTTQQRIRGEVETERGMEAEPEEAREAREAPGLYTRGGVE